MLFLLSVIHSKNPVPHTPEEIAAIDAFNDEIESKGYRRLAVGLETPSKSRVFDNRAGMNDVTSGPLVDSDEFVAGLWVIDVPSEEIAHELAARGSNACNRKVELRAMLR